MVARKQTPAQRQKQAQAQAQRKLIEKRTAQLKAAIQAIKKNGYPTPALVRKAQQAYGNLVEARQGRNVPKSLLVQLNKALNLQPKAKAHPKAAKAAKPQGFWSKLFGGSTPAAPKPKAQAEPEMRYPWKRTNVSGRMDHVLASYEVDTTTFELTQLWVPSDGAPTNAWTNPGIMLFKALREVAQDVVANGPGAVDMMGVVFICESTYANYGGGTGHEPGLGGFDPRGFDMFYQQKIKQFRRTGALREQLQVKRVDVLCWQGAYK